MMASSQWPSRSAKILIQMIGVVTYDSIAPLVALGVAEELAMARKGVSLL